MSAGSSIAKDALHDAGVARAERAFNAIYDGLITNWKDQTDELIKRIFDGEDVNIKILTEIFKDGNLIDGKGVGRKNQEGEHTANWEREENIKRAFYAAAIPGAWTANRPHPVVVDFGGSCEIDARDYFNTEPSVYNNSWRCPDGHSYILAGVSSGQNQCGPSVPGGGGGCMPVDKWTLSVLKGIQELQDDDNQWGGVTVDDLIIG
ncbi:hypothetical protein IMZ48_11125 [Candidatus Bathyarchaeota archaeon]|nr:hypothetical protein [Candidatus Bathyarchaeota archaeon]